MESIEELAEKINKAANMHTDLEYPMGVDREYPINDFKCGVKWAIDNLNSNRYTVEKVIKCLYYNSGQLDISTNTLNELIIKTNNIMAKVIQVCDEDNCDNQPVMGVDVGNKTHNFCCQKGFEKSLNDFKKYINPEKDRVKELAELAFPNLYLQQEGFIKGYHDSKEEFLNSKNSVEVEGNCANCGVEYHIHK